MHVGSKNNETSQSSVDDVNEQYNPMLPDNRSSISTLYTHQPRHLDTQGPTGYPNTAMSSQIVSQPVNAQPYPQNHAIGMNTSPEGVAPDFTKGNQTYPTYSEPNANQNIYSGSDHPRPYNRVPPISTNVMSSASGLGVSYLSNPSPQNQPTYMPPQSAGPSLNQSFSNLTVTHTTPAPPQYYSSNFQKSMHRTDSYASQTEGAFSPPPTSSQNGSLKGIKQVKNALT